MEKIESRWTSVGRGIALAGGIISLGIMFIMTADGIGRKFLHPVTGSLEISQIMLGYCVFFSVAYSFTAGAQVKVTLLFDRFSFTPRLIMNILIAIIAVFLFGILFTYGILDTESAYTGHELMYPARLLIPFWINKIALPIGIFFPLVLFLIYVVRDVKRLAIGREQKRKVS